MIVNLEVDALGAADGTVRGIDVDIEVRGRNGQSCAVAGEAAGVGACCLVLACMHRVWARPSLACVHRHTQLKPTCPHSTSLPPAPPTPLAAARHC